MSSISSFLRLSNRIAKKADRASETLRINSEFYDVLCKVLDAPITSDQFHIYILEILQLLDNSLVIVEESDMDALYMVVKMVYNDLTCVNYHPVIERKFWNVVATLRDHGYEC